jgi:hypothetical protein
MRPMRPIVPSNKQLACVRIPVLVNDNSNWQTQLLH